MPHSLTCYIELGIHDTMLVLKAVLKHM